MTAPDGVEGLVARRDRLRAGLRALDPLQSGKDVAEDAIYAFEWAIELCKKLMQEREGEQKLARIAVDELQTEIDRLRQERDNARLLVIQDNPAARRAGPQPEPGARSNMAGPCSSPFSPPSLTVQPHPTPAPTRRSKEMGESQKNQSQQTASVIAEVQAERVRQIDEEGWSAVHDDGHGDGELARAAACYAFGERLWCAAAAYRYNEIWPWDKEWWKPMDERHNLIRAAALIVAEIERLDRAQGKRR